MESVEPSSAANAAGAAVGAGGRRRGKGRPAKRKSSSSSVRKGLKDDKSGDVKSRKKEVKEQNEDGLRMPLCSVCGVDWYDFEEEGEGKRRPSACKLMAQPACKCATKLCVGAGVSRVWGNLAICRPCLTMQIKSSSEVIEHDYRDTQQPNPKFTVEPKCPICQVKFSKRTLLKMLDNGSEYEWNDAVRITLSLISDSKHVSSLEPSDHRHTQTLQKGELLADLRKKDPRLDQELNDLHFIQNKMATKNGRKELGIEGDETLKTNSRANTSTQDTHNSLLAAQRERRRNMEMEDQRLAKQLQKELEKDMQKQLRKSYHYATKSNKRNANTTSNTKSKSNKRQKITPNKITTPPAVQSYNSSSSSSNSSSSSSSQTHTMPIHSIAHSSPHHKIPIKKDKSQLLFQPSSDDDDDDDDEHHFSRPTHTLIRKRGKTSPSSQASYSSSTATSTPSPPLKSSHPSISTATATSSASSKSQTQSPPPPTPPLPIVLSKPTKPNMITKAKKSRQHNSIPPSIKKNVLSHQNGTRNQEQNNKPSKQNIPIKTTIKHYVHPKEDSSHSDEDLKQEEEKDDKHVVYSPNNTTTTNKNKQNAKTQKHTKSHTTTAPPPPPPSSPQRTAKSQTKNNNNNNRKKQRETRATLNNEAITQLVSMGFHRTNAKRCLRDADGDVQLAISMLLSASGAAGDSTTAASFDF